MAEKEDKTLEVMFKKIRDDIAKYRKEAKEKKLKFTGLTEKELWRKLSKAESPLIGMHIWNDAPRGGLVTYRVRVYNPDSYTQFMYVYVFVGPANFVQVRGRAVLTVDTRFPQLIQPDWPALELQSWEEAWLDFHIAVPKNIETSNYMGNAFLFFCNYHGIGTLYDRASFIFKVS